MKQIIFLEPIFKEMIWGGNRLSTHFNYNIPSENTGEAWVISAHKKGDCLVKNGKFKGKTLNALWKNHKELFAYMSGDTFPLLVKIIDAKEDLSIQVHPDDTYAKEHENGSLGKTECWYILDCQEQSSIIMGHKAKNKTELETMIYDSRWSDLLQETPINKDDFFQIPSGTVHAIKAGTLILEIQQNSDITYRLYDYDRLSNGKPRPLHVEKSIDVINCPHDNYVRKSKIKESENGRIEELISYRYYTVRKIEVWDKITLKQEEPFSMINVIEGSGTIDGTAIHKGDSFILPNGYDDYTLSGELTLVLSFPGMLS